MTNEPHPPADRVPLRPADAPPTLINALLDALAALGVEHIDMPATPLRVWESIRAARR